MSSPQQICVSPIDGKEFARRPLASEAEISKAIAAARAAQKTWRAVSLTERSKAVAKFLDAMLAKNGEIIPELAWQMGRPTRYGGEARPLEERVRYMIQAAQSGLADVEPEGQGGSRRVIKREPVGIVLVIAPWNYPFLTAVNTIVPALLAGNAVILKHATQTILAGERFQAAMDEAGLPKGLFQNLILDHEQVAKLLGSGEIGHCNFTGSVGAGFAIQNAVGRTFASIGLELGGKDPAYVRADADLNHAIENLVDGAFYNSGQCCCGIERIYVHESLYSTFVDGFSALTAKYVLGNPLDEATTLGPMAHARFADVVRKQIAQAVKAGAKTHVDPAGFPAHSDHSAFLAPQVLTNVDHSMSVMRDESFGPVVGIMKVGNDDEAVKLMNDSEYGLTAAIWTSDVRAAEALGAQIETGTVFMNRCDYLDPALAWTGVKHTGRGVSLSTLAYGTLTRPKSYHLRHTL